MSDRIYCQVAQATSKLTRPSSCRSGLSRALQTAQRARQPSPQLTAGVRRTWDPVTRVPIMRRFTSWAAGVFLVALALVYVAAKVDFFRRFDPDNLSAYIAGHWPFWAAFIILAGLIVLLERVGPHPRQGTGK